MSVVLDVLLEWLRDPANLIPKVLVPLFLAIVFWSAGWGRRLAAWMGGRVSRWYRGVRAPLDERLQRYRDRLDEQTFRIHHAWMREGQTLADILVPVAIESGTIEGIEGGIDEWTGVLARLLGGASESRCVVLLGGPGAGKTVALRVAAREAWTLRLAGEQRLVPVLLNFSRYREHEFNLCEALAASMEQYGFTSAQESAEVFVRQRLEEGSLLILLDGLDELEPGDRKQAEIQLTRALHVYERARVILTCRTAAWRGLFSELSHVRVPMAPFTPVAVRSFVRHWSFGPPKSSEELLATIEAQPHIGELARSPLMLTIICFLYSQPKYHLPENRAVFYEYCSHALLEEWDQHRNPDQANRFERHHKESVLAELAFRHLSSGRSDADLDERDVLERIAEIMRCNALVPAENLRMLDEIRERSGLLVRMPPSGLRFPHQTFLEFFAALYLHEREPLGRLLELHEQDSQRWRETLLLYVGLSSSPAVVRELIEYAEAREDDALALAMLTDARALEPEVAQRVLARVSARLRSALAEPSSLELIVHLGQVASNARMAHAETAASALRGLLELASSRRDDPLAPQTLEALLLASLRRPVEETSRFVVEHLEELRFTHVLPVMGERVSVLSAKIIGDRALSIEKKYEWIEGLRRARAVGALLELLGSTDVESEVHGACVQALVGLSSTEEFERAVQTQVHVRVEPTDEVWERWGWPFERPAQSEAQKLIMYLAERWASMEVIEIEQDSSIDCRIGYLALGLSSSRNLRMNQSEDSEAYPSEEGYRVAANTSVRVLHAIWIRMGSTRWCAWMAKDRVWNGAMVLSMMAASVLSIWCIKTCAYAALGWEEGMLRWPAAAALLTMELGFCGFFLWDLVNKGDGKPEDVFAILTLGVMAPCCWVIMLTDILDKKGRLLSALVSHGVLVIVASLLALTLSDDSVLRILCFACLTLGPFSIDFSYSDVPLHPFVTNASTRALVTFLSASEEEEPC